MYIKVFEPNTEIFICDAHAIVLIEIHEGLIQFQEFLIDAMD